MKNKISIIGGDLRNIRLAQLLTYDGVDICTYGLENSNDIQDDDGIKIADNIKDVLGFSDIIISSIPFSKDGKKINSPFSEKEILINDIVDNIDKNKLLIAGNINRENLYKLNKKCNRIIDIMKCEELVVLNTIATAEGTIDIAIQNTEKNLQGSNVLVLGFGRVGKIVAERFKALKTEVTCAARKSSDLAWIKTYGYDNMDINNLNERLNNYDIIINTVPEVIIGERELKFMKRNTLLIDLASAPGGIDFEEAKKQKRKCIWALAIPGKISPLSTAEFIKEIIYKKINEL